MPKYRVTYKRMLTLRKTIEADSYEEAQRLAESQSYLKDSDFEDGSTDIDVKEVKIMLLSRVKVIAEGNLKGSTGTVKRIDPYDNGRKKMRVDFSTVIESFWDDEIEPV